MKIEEAIEGAYTAIKAGTAPLVVQMAIVNAGIKPKQSETIMRWAAMRIDKEKE